ncbi:peptidase S28 [Amanita rubescens]|nr:peptidase S28 [Amanita rubescens]
MPVVKCLAVLASLAVLPTLYALGPLNGPQAANFWRLGQLQNARSSPPNQLLARNTSEFQPQWFRQPLDHFYNETTDTWLQRFWVSTRHYKHGSGGPVVVLDGGEIDASTRLPYLDTGIVDILTNHLGGIGVVLEHRYYGESIATQNLTTDSLRFLNNEQALADSANFMANVKFEGIDEDLTAPKTPWIYYGGSYAGARSAIMKVVYPHLVYGAIASSGVAEALINDWEYFEVIRRAANSECISRLETAVLQIDSIIAEGKHTQALKTLFGLQNITHDVDFISTISMVLGDWQNKNWNPAVNSDDFDIFCSYMNAMENANTKTVLVDGYPVDIGLFNYGKYTKEASLPTTCTQPQTQDECFGTFNDTAYQITTLDQTWRLWQFQVCTQWGFYQAAPPDPNHPRIVSRFLTIDYAAKICKQAFLPGKYFTVPPQPNVTDVNRHGGYAIAADRLAIIDGQVDPWRPCTAHADVAPPRPDTVIRPFKLIPNAVHHYDENGLADINLEPPEIRAIHLQEVAFVGAWLKSFNTSLMEY